MNKKRLLKLANHLRNGKLGHKVFDFENFNTNINALGDWRSPNNRCGTNGCAIGECPIVWPEQWSFGEFGAILLTGSNKSNLEAASKWFNLTPSETKFLFVPGQPHNGFLPASATKEMVAERIEKYISNDPFTVQQLNLVIQHKAWV